jgi:hypothetical protein
MKLFSEKVNPTLTNSSQNILSVESFEEIFFGVYEIEINKSKYPVEKISEHNGNPIVSLPVLVKGVKKYYPFVLIQGKFEVLFNENNTINKVVDNFEEPPSVIVEHAVEDSPVSVEEEISVPELIDNKKQILEQIEKAKKEAVYFASKIKKQKLDEANLVIKSKKKALENMVRDARSSLVTEFVSVSKKIKDEFIDENDSRFEEIKETINNKISDMSDTLWESLKKDFNTSEKQFESKIRQFVKELYESLQPQIDNELKEIATQIVEKVDTIEKDLGKKLETKVDKVVIENFEGELNSIAKANIELNDKINKGVNKALSRVGNADKKVDELTIALSEEVNDRVNKAEDHITNYYKERIKLLEDKTFELNEETRKYFIEVITESRNNLIEEVRKLKNEKPIEYIVESKGKKQTINSDDLVKDFDKKINSKIDNEVTRLRRYIAVYSGGGSVAMQFADGGTMNGNLNVNGNLTVFGTISASEYLGISTGGSSGSDVSGLSANWQNTYTTVLANSGAWGAVSDPVKTTLTGNGTLSTFFISGANNLINPSAITVAIDGALQEPIVDYSLSGGFITFTSPIPNGSKAVVISPTNSLQVSQMVPADGSVTSTKLASDIAIAGQLTAPNQLINTSNDVLTVESMLDEDFIFVHDDFWGGGTISNQMQSPIGWAATVIQGSSTARYGRHTFLNIPCAGSVSLLTGANRRDGVAIYTNTNHSGGGVYNSADLNSTAIFKVRFKLADSTSYGLRIGFTTPPASGVINPTRFIGMDATPSSTAWNAGQVIALNEYRRPTVANGRRYYASVAGTTSGSEPTWPTSATVVDGTVTWTEDGRDGNVNFQFLTRDSTDRLTGTIQDSGIVVDTNWHIFTMRYNGSNNWRMSIDSGVEQSLTISTTTLNFSFLGQNYTTSARECLIDYFRFLQIGRP